MSKRTEAELVKHVEEQHLEIKNLKNKNNLLEIGIKRLKHDAKMIIPENTKKKITCLKNEINSLNKRLNK